MKIWSAKTNDWLDLTFGVETITAMGEFIKAQIAEYEDEDGCFFSAYNEVFDIGEISRAFEEHGLDTVSFVAAFCPDGWGVTQHGHDDFAIEPID